MTAIKSMLETIKHIRRVQCLMEEVIWRLMQRARVHDESKLVDPEVSVFAECTERLSGMTYGSAEYKQCLVDMGPALTHHYAFNRHHPEHWPNGVYDMTLLDLLEMLIDWKAASERHANGSMEQSLDINRKRFGYSNELAEILSRTAVELWPAHREPWHCCGCGNGGAQGYFCEMCGAGKDDYQSPMTTGEPNQ